MTDKFLTIDELATALGGLGRASIYRHIKSLHGFFKTAQNWRRNPLPAVRGPSIHSRGSSQPRRSSANRKR